MNPIFCKQRPKLTFLRLTIFVNGKNLAAVDLSNIRAIFTTTVICVARRMKTIHKDIEQVLTMTYFVKA